MKKLLLIALAFIGLQVTAQGQKPNHHKEGNERFNALKNLSAEDAATLQTKKMTLALDLNESQQKDIYKINLENATKRKAHMEAWKAKKESGTAEKPSQEERVKMMNAMLDHKIAEKAKMKKILNDDQYTKWEKAQKRMAHMHKEGMKNRQDRGDRNRPEREKRM